MPAHFKAVHSSGADIASTETFSSSPRHSPFVSGATTVAGQALGARGRRGSKRGLAKGDMDEPSLALRRRKHNELEIKRRKRLNDRYEELHQHLGCAHTRLAILETAIARLKHAESQIKALNIVLDAVKKHPGNLFVGTRNPKSESSSCQAPTASSTTARMLAAFDCVDVPLLVLLPNGSVADCSQSFCELIGFTKDVLRQSTIFSLASESDLSELYGVINKLVSKEISSHFLDLQLTHEEGKPVSFKCLICVDADKTTGKVCSMFLFGQASPIFSHQSTN
jgi:PAS domain S-box-containing protein